ncbi:integrase core domain-containing protein [Streptomyces sp. NPDC052023]|uniref:integrase core domain-containing protein n=1 Tax=Streptomyces sp. NPDC052023 TaxID=3365681 RepID=UPI0037D57B04
MLQRPVESEQYTSLSPRRAPRLGRNRRVHRIVGDAYDNALMESTIGLFKTELTKPRRPFSGVELATAEWIDWYCHRRLHGEIGHISPANTKPTTTAKPQNPSSQPKPRVSTKPGAVHCSLPPHPLNLSVTPQRALTVRPER